MDRIRMFKSIEIPLPLWIEGGMMCPLCGVISTPYPCYEKGEGTTVPHQLSYCGHMVEGNLIRLAIWSEPKELCPSLE